MLKQKTMLVFSKQVVSVLSFQSAAAIRPSLGTSLGMPMRLSMRLASSQTSKGVLSNAGVMPLIPERGADLTELEKQDAIVKRRRALSREIVKIWKPKPRTPGQRWVRIPVYTHLWKKGPLRALTIHKKQTGGRNKHGRITSRSRGGQNKRRLRLVDFNRKEPGAHEVVRIEYDPNRTSHIALLKSTETGTFSYIIACEGLRAGDIVESYRQGIPQKLIDEMGGVVDPAIVSAKTRQRGNCLPLSMIPVGAVVHNVGLLSNGPAKLCRAAGAYARLLQKIPEKKRAVVRLQSGEHRYVHIDSCATLGTVSNAAHRHVSLGKAGRARWMGRRPHVRGVAMNKCDHPHGGGRGKSKSNKLSMSPWGTLAKGYKTRRGKNQNKMKVKDRPRGKHSARG